MTAVELLLVRHGNTFAPGDRIVWVGKNEDLPLVHSGRVQAEALGATLLRDSWIPSATVSGGLKRQVEHLGIAAPPGSPDPQRDAALDEVDYGVWGGLTTDEIVERHGEEEVRLWNEASVWPTRAGWPETEAEVRTRVRDFVERVGRGDLGTRVLACSSNGLLRWFLDCVPGALEAALHNGTFKVKTGHVGKLHLTGSGEVTLAFWNRDPSRTVLHGDP